MVYAFIGIFGVAGALLRYWLGLSMGMIWHYTFPFATLMINLIGCFILGWITTYISRINIIPPNLVTGLGTVLIGSFTTFSTFSVETVKLVLASHCGLAFLYVMLSLWGGLMATYFGFRLGHVLFGKRNELKPGVITSEGRS